MDFLFDDDAGDLAYFGKPPRPSYVRPTAKRGTLRGDLILFDLRIVLAVRQFLDNCGASVFLRHFVSNNPLKDVSLLTWCCTIFGVWEIGFRMFWLSIFSIFIGSILRAIIRAPRPFEYDMRIRPLSDFRVTAFAFPAMESYMAVVTYGYVAYRASKPVWFALASVMIIFIACTRIFAGTRFVHQILLSWALGVVTLALYISRFEPLVPNWGSNKRQNEIRLLLMAPWILALLAYVALAIEDGSSSLFRIPGSEYRRVLTGIIDGGGVPNDSTAAEQTRPEPADSGDGAWREEQRKRRLAARRDSFYFLQREMQLKSSEKRALLRERRSFGDGDGLAEE